MRARHLISRVGCVGAISVLLLGLPAGTSFAQQIDITPATSITPSSHVTTWVFQMAIAAAVLGVLILIALGLGYLRFAPKFFGREEQPVAGPPGTRPQALVRQAAAVRWTPPPPGHAPSGPASPAPARAATATATAVAERPAPSARPAPAEAPAAEAAAAAAASVTPTAGPSGEPAVQADAVGAAEAAAPEPRPTAKTPEEIGAPPAAAPAAPPTAAATPSPAPAAAPAAPPTAAATPSPAPAAAPAAAPTPPAPAPTSHGASAALDQETFDRVLEQQLAKGVDRRVAEGRARAAAVVAARKKSQG